MKKDVVIGGIEVVVILGGIVGYAVMKPAAPEAPRVTDTSALPPSQYAEHAPYYDIAANYATSTPLTGDANASAVALMRNFIAQTIAQFKTDGNFANLTPTDVKMLGFDQGKRETLQIKYLIASSPHTVSYIFTTYTDTLGAHGNMTFTTFVFDTNPSTSSGQAGAPLALADLFTPGIDYLVMLSQISREKLPAVIGSGVDASFVSQFIDPGTTPDEKNFENFFFDNNQLVILFAPYQVAPYSAGPQTLRIPVADLANILKPEYR